MKRFFGDRCAWVAGVLIGLLSASAYGQVPLAQVPRYLPGYEDLSQQREKLSGQRDHLNALIVEHNNKTVPEDTPVAERLRLEGIQLREMMIRHVAASKDFNARVMAAETDFRTNSVKGKALAWEDKEHPERKAWSDELRWAIAKNIGTLEKAKDITDFAPNYNKSLPLSQRLDIWASLFTAIAKKESDTRDSGGQLFDTNAEHRETDGQISRGLFQIGYNAAENPDNFYGRYARANGESLAELMDEANNGLNDPKVNIKCAVIMFATLVDRYGRIAGGPNRDGKYENGADGYWSTLQEGKKHEIQEMVKKQALAE